MVCSILKFGTGHNFPFSEKDHGLYIAHVFYHKQVKNKLLILTHHLNGLFLSFQKITKLTLLDQRN